MSAAGSTSPGPPEPRPAATEAEEIAGVLVVGSGYAGMHAAKASKDAGVTATILDPEGVHGFTTRLAAVAGGTASEGDAFAPLEAFGHPVRRGRVVGLEDGLVVLDGGARLKADAVVISAGARAASPDIPGIELAMPLRSPADALRLRDRAKSAEQVSIIGGGATGTQLAGALAVSRPDLTVRVVDREPRLLTAMGASVGERAREILEDRGVELHLETELEQIEPAGITLSNGRLLEGLPVWAGGFESVIGELGDGLPDDEGRLRVTDDLRIAEWSRTFAAGDVAAHRDRNDALLPMDAQVAVRAGAAAGKNAARIASGREPEPASLSHRGWVVDLGGGLGVAQLGPVSLSTAGIDRIPLVLHHAVDLKHLFEIGGAGALRFAIGRHLPSPESVDRLMVGSDAAIQRAL